MVAVLNVVVVAVVVARVVAAVAVVWCNGNQFYSCGGRDSGGRTCTVAW